MSFSHWLHNLRNRIQTPPKKRRHRKSNRPNSAALHTALNSATESLEDRTLLSAVFEVAPTTQDITLSIGNSGNLQIEAQNSVVFSEPLSSVDDLTIVGNDLDNTLTVDFANGNPVPLGGLTFDGVNRGTDYDTLTFSNGQFQTFVNNAENPHDGVIDLTFEDGSSSTVTYRNIEPLSNDGTVADILFNLPAIGNPDVVLQNNTSFGAGAKELLGSTFENTIFLNATNSLTVNLGAMDDSLTVNTLDSFFDADLEINGESGTDTVTVATDIDIATGNLTVDSETIAVNADVEAAAVTLTGTVTLNANFDFGIGGTSPGSMMNQHEQFVVNGGLTIAGGTPTFTARGGFTPSQGNVFVIIDNDMSDPVTGTFTGLAEGATISNFLGSGLDATITYQGGDGNDIVITVPVDTEVTLSGGTLTITDANGANSNDTLTISYSGGTYTITDVGGLILDPSTIVGSTGTGTSTVTVPDTGVTGINFDVLGGNDSVTVNSVQPSLSGNFTITGGAGSDTATINGDIVTTGTGAVNITVSRNIVLGSGSSLTTVDGGITLTANAAGTTAGNFAGISADNATLSTNSGAISLAGTGGDTGDDNLGIEILNGALIDSNGTGTITVSGTGGAGTSSGSTGVQVSDATTVIESVDGNIQVTGIAPSGVGVNVNSASVASTGSASITIDGTSTSPAFRRGVEIQTNADVSSVNGDIQVTGMSRVSDGIFFTGATLASTGSAAINIQGTSISTSNIAEGVLIANTDVSSITGDIQITGVTAGSNGVGIANGATVSSAGAATITIDGTTTSNNGSTTNGVFLSNTGGDAQIASSGGTISITGTTAGGGTAGDGVEIQSGLTEAIRATNGAAIILTGTGDGADSGVQIDSPITSATGDVTIRSEDGDSTTDDITFGAGGDITSISGSVTIDADNAGDTADVVMVDGTVINAGSGTIDIDTDVNVTIGELITSGDVQITAVAGAVLDTADAGANDVTAATLLLIANGNVGMSADFLETQIQNIEGTAGTSGTGGLWVSNTGSDLIVGGVDGAVTGVSANGNIAIYTGTAVDDDLVVMEAIDSNGGNVEGRASNNVIVIANVDSDGGSITLNADTDQAVISGGSINVEMATIDSSGGNIVLGGGADPTMNPAIGTLTNVDEDGIRVHLATITSGAGNISIRGSSALSEDGVDVGDSASVLATTGNITIDGAATGMDDGVDIHDGSTISTTSGNITITGTASGGNAEDGVLITGPAMLTTTSVTTETGLITITGNGDDEDSGVELGGFVVIESTGVAAGAITIDGTSATPTLFDEAGTFVEGPVTIRSVTGPIDITGTSSDGDGLVFVTDSLVQSTGTGATAATITLTGDGGLDGVVLFEATVSSVDGNILLDGSGDDFEGVVVVDGLVASTGATASTAATITILGDTTGNNSDGIAIVDNTTGSAINSVAGAISLTGIADGASMSLDGVFVESMSQIASTGTGADAASITIMGTAGVNFGVDVEGAVTSVDGNIQIAGDAAGTGNSGVQLDNGSTISSTGTGNITITSTDNSTNNDDVELVGGATVQTASGDIDLQSGDDILIPTGSTVSAGGQLRIAADFADADGAVGTQLTLEGTLSTVTRAQILGGADNDTFTLDPDSTTGSLLLDGQGGDDSYEVQFGNLGGQVDIDDQAAEGTDDLTLKGSGMPNVFTIGAAQTTLSGQTVTYTANLESIEVEGEGGADTFDVTPSMTATIDIVGGDPTMAPGDTVNFMTPAGQSVAVTPDGADGGTFSTSGGFLDVTFDEIEATSFTGDSLTVNSGGEDDLYDLTLTGAGAGTLAVTTDVDAMPGPTGMINIMFSGLEQIIANGEGGDDVFRQNNAGGPLGLLNGIEFNGGAGSDTLEVLNGTATTVAHSFTNANDGSIGIDAFGLVYTGLEPILDTITATTRTFTFAGTDDDITLADLGGGMSRISSVSSSETVDFTNPTGSLTINAGDGADTVDASASAVAVTINGGGGADEITGTSLADAINGDAGNDSITGGVGNDVIDGGADDDLMIWNNGDGSDMMDGGAGTDELEVNGSTVSPAGDVITISANATRFDLTRADGGAGLGPFSLDVGTIETLDLNTLDGGDTVTVNDLTGVADLATLTIEVGAGNDTVDASALPDLGLGLIIEGGDDDDTLTGGAGSSTINGNMGNDSLIGGAAADTIMGGGGDDVMDGGAGGDMLSGQAGNDTMTGGLGDDTLNGGADTDHIIESGDTDFDLGDTSLVSPLTGTDVVTDVEEAMLTGGASANTIDASDFSGTTTLMGGDNDDTITGAMGASAINGNMGNDQLTGLGAADTLMGGGGDDVMDGGTGGDMLTGQAGDDTMTGGLGDDTLNGGADTDQIIESGNTDFDLGDTSLVSPLTGTDVVTDVEEAMLTGGASANTIDASDFSGTTTLMGGDNDDTITGAMGASAINGNMGNDQLTGLGAADTMMGGGGDDLMDGGSGGDMLTGQAGDDTMTGGLGDDTLNGGADTDLVVESGDTDFDLGDTSLVSPLTGSDVLADVEEADLTGGASANTIDASDFSGVATLTGNDGDDTMNGAQGSSIINGNMGNDSLLGLGAADGIMGGGGNDIIDGGAGNDTLTGQANDDTITGNTGDDNIMGGDGADLINGSLGNDTISGDDGDDRIQGSNLSDYPGTPLNPIPDLNTLGQTDRDSLLGGAGSDTIAGAIGADFIDGEADADIIDAQSGGDTTNGIDTIVGDVADTIFRDPEDTVL